MMTLMKDRRALLSVFTLFTVLINFVNSGPSCIFISSLNDGYKIVNTESGAVRSGIRTTLLEKMEFYAFKGIPYAKPPIGERRFKAPEPIEPWRPKILDALEHGKNCIQIATPLSTEMQQSEDCLFLNIYVPADVKDQEKLPVLVHIHGGVYALYSGDDIALGPDFLIEKRVIVVTLNYRLGVFGFMSFGTPEYSGNMGLKDQQLALKRIYSNIEQFSGDNKRITLSGLSAGSTSTHFHMHSNESRKYFRNAFLMSGTSDDFWAYSEENNHLEYANQSAQALGSQNIQSVDELIEFYKSQPADKLRMYGNVLGLYRRLIQPTLGPVLERKDAIRPLMTEVNQNASIDMDAMFSYSANEYISFYSILFPEVYNFSDLNTNFTIPLPFRGVNLSYDSPEYQQIAKEIRQHYFKDEVIDDSSLMQYLALLTDINFAYGIDKSAKQHARNTKFETYYYRFSVDSKLNIFKNVLSGNGHLNGTAHGDDLCYLFRCWAVQPLYDEILQNPNDEQSVVSLRTIDSLSRIVANFVKYGEPTYRSPKSSFLPIEKNRVNFLDITNNGPKPGVNPNQAANELWASIEQRVRQMNTRN